MKSNHNNMQTSPTFLARPGLVLVALLTAVLAGNAQQAKPAADLAAVPDQFKFQGSWECTGAFGNGKVHRSTFTGDVILGGKWIELAEQDVEPSTGYLAKYLIGYDSQQKRIVEFDANNFGAATYSSAEGWQNRTLTLTSPVTDDPGAPYAANRFIFSITAPDTFTMDWQVSKHAALQWVPGDHLACKRSVHS